MARKRRQRSRPSERPAPRTRPARRAPASEAARIGALALLLALAGTWAYAPSFDGVLVLDDVRAIVRNPTITTLWPLSTPLSPPPASTVAGRPVANVSFAVNYALAPAAARQVFRPGGPDAPPGTADLFLRNVWGYHLGNLIIHVAAGLVLAGVIRRTLRTAPLRLRFETSATWIAFAAAAVWLLHPLQTAAVTYVVQRVESLMGLFYLLTLYCAIRARESVRPRAWAACAVACCALGAGTKEVIATAPAIVALWDWTFSDRDGHGVRWRLVSALAGTWAVLGALLLHEHRGPSIDLSPGIVWQYALTQTQVVAHYLQLAVVPSPLVFFYTWPLAASLALVAGPAALIVALLALTVAGLARRVPAAFAGAWFFVILAPTSSVLPIVTEVAAEHRMYLPLAAVVTCAVAGGWIGIHAVLSRLVPGARLRAWPGTALAVALCVVVAAGCGLATRARNRDYSSEERLWRDTVEKQPDNSRARVALGEVLANAGRLREAEAHLRRALELDPADPAVRVRLGSVLAQQERFDEAVPLWEQALVARPDDADAHRLLGLLYAMRRQDALAVRHLERTLDIVNDDPMILTQLAAILADSDDASVKNAARAVAAAGRAAQLTGRRDVRALEILAVALDASGASREAVATAHEALLVARAQGDQALVSRIESRVASIESRAGIRMAR